jgi:DNA-binding NtrC family response regulator
MFLKQEYDNVQVETDPEQLPALLKVTDFDVILLDMNFRRGVNDGEEGFFWLNQIRDTDPQAVVILITAYGEVDLAVRAMKDGAFDFVLKPWKNQKLKATIQAALQLRASRNEVARLKGTQAKLNDDSDQPYRDFIGESPAIFRVREMIDRVAGTDADVLVLGENGTGKELVARAIHRNSPRSDKVFISVDLGAITETLFETELFGHVKGAFTDARNDKPGRFEIAAEGTLFLDEIGNLSLPLQSKLLTVLQQRKVQKVGSSKEIPVNFRLICATNMQLHEMVYEKSFRQDLLYRINTVEIRVPALRERSDDIPLLLEFFLKRYAAKYKRQDIRIEKSVITRLKRYHWPGNIRELQHAVERAVILTDSRVIHSADLFLNTTPTPVRSEQKPVTLEEMERKFIEQSLAEHGGNVSNTARALGMTRTALYRRMKKHGIG